MTLVHLRSATTSFVAVTDGDALPVVLHWGARLPETIGESEILAATRAVVPHSSTDQPLVRRLVPLPVDGWRLRPALSGSYADGTHFAPRFTAATVESDDRHLRVVANDRGTGLRLESAYTLHADGLLEIATEVTNDGPGVFLLSSCESSLPIPVEVTEVLDLTGRWCRERSPQRLTLPMGSWMRESRHGRTGHDAPLALCVGDPGFGFRSGRVWAIHLGWSGDSRVYAERSPGGFAQVGAGELVAPGEVILAPGQAYTAPPLFAAFSDRGLDGISAAFHGFVRSRATHPSAPRKVLLNTWEAVYFDHRLEVLTDLADKAADAGIERFVLDDGWFGGRRNDGRGLGDWYVSPEVWPDGLTPLIEHVRSRGMDFGLWVEPEMANPDSDLVREHPEWLLAVPGRDPLLWRRQQVVDLANPDCFAHILDRLDAILRDNDIAFLKWDHNRDLIDAAHEGRPAVRVQTLALYALLDEPAAHPEVAIEVLDLTGRWCRERTPQRTPLHMGSWSRESRHGRTGHDAAYVMCAGTPGFGFRHGRVWAVHHAWSGDSRLSAERNPVGAAHLAAGELLAAGEVRLAEGETYAAPEVLAVYSDRGLDGVTNAFHDYVRARPSHPAPPRPVLLNTWEAVYFDHRLEVLKGLADAAAKAGVERFVLDDGWFGSRRDDGSGLGDWVVSADVWPDGLTPLIDYVRSLGMEFGLWVEPEMCNLDSDLVREHPDWVLAVPGRRPPMWRRQQVVDLANPACFAHVLGQLDALLRENDIAFLKWDHNRDLIDPAHDGRPAVRAQTLAAYRLLDALRDRHPGVEIETCASGGGRVDLGILARTDRVWASDTIDAVERQHIQLWTGLLVPPELVGAHIGGPHAHTTGRSHSFAMRAASAVFGHMGIEWNLAALSERELALVTAAVAWHKEHRGLLHSGDVVRLDQPTRDAIAHGVVSRDRREAVFCYAQLGTDVTEVPGRLRLDGLDPALDYRVEPVTLGQAPGTQQVMAPLWLGDGGVVARGAMLMTLGLALPVLHPEQALLIRLAAV